MEIKIPLCNSARTSLWYFLENLLSVIARNVRFNGALIQIWRTQGNRSFLIGQVETLLAASRGKLEPINGASVRAKAERWLDVMRPSLSSSILCNCLFRWKTCNYELNKHRYRENSYVALLYVAIVAQEICFVSTNSILERSRLVSVCRS